MLISNKLHSFRNFFRQIYDSLSTHQKKMIISSAENVILQLAPLWSLPIQEKFDNFLT